jgi:methionyl-tRNA synthetase
MQDKIRAWVDRSTEWPHLARSIAYKWLDEGLIDRSITRDLSWGVKVLQNGKPRPGFENKVFYVWFDAPIEYIASTVEWSEATGGNWERWWRTDKGAHDVLYVEFMGKDNVAFHTVSFPVTIMGSGEPWKLVDRLKAFNWVTWYGGKFSTSEQRGIFMDQALELLPSDYWRWYLMANAPETADAPFTLEHFQQTVNADLANVLGNFVNRIMRFAESRFDSQVPDGGELGEPEKKLDLNVDAALSKLQMHHEAMESRKAAAETRAIWVLGNEYLQEAAPWTAIKTDRDRAAVGVRMGLNLCALFAIIAQPFIPDAAETILGAIGVPNENRRWPSAHDRGLLDALPRGLRITPPAVLFRKVEDEQIAEWAARFGAGA